MSDWKLVPVDPTEEMIAAVGDVIGPCETPEQIYRAMIAAAPAVSAQLVGYMKVSDIKLINTCEHETAQVFSRPHGNVTIPVYLHPPAPAVVIPPGYRLQPLAEFDAIQHVNERAAVADKLAEALRELADLMEGARTGEYTPDSFTCQPARAALAELEQLKGH